MPVSNCVSRARRGAAAGVAGAGLLAAFSACALPFGLGLPTTRALETGAANTLSAAQSLEIVGSYTESGQPWTIDLQIARPDDEHVVARGPGVSVEAIVLGTNAYYRGQAFLSQHMGGDPLSRNVVKAAGNAWWMGSIGLVPLLPDLIDGGKLKSTFLGTAATQRTDHVSVDGVDAIDLSGPRADVFIRAAPPYDLLRVHMKNGVVIDGLGAADLRFENFNRNFGIAAPTDVIDFSNLSTLPPIYSVDSVDASRCGSPCVVSAQLTNLGGKTGAVAPSTITFTMTAAASGKVTGTCTAPVTPDVGYNGTTTVSCTIGNLNGPPGNAATITAVADNPGHA
ncbi:MAG TPA: hypothetical protein VNU19_05860 [Candidatus Acidoferrum sp.]|nr:hypothetical protein [Candidatus Acidoferrum sp.]